MPIIKSFNLVCKGEENYSNCDGEYKLDKKSTIFLFLWKWKITKFLPWIIRANFTESAGKIFVN